MSNPASLPRRGFIRGVAASAITGACVPSLVLHRHAAAAPPALSTVTVASSFMEANTTPPRYHLTLAGSRSDALPGRAHGLAVNSDRSLVVSFARRPERWMQVYRRDQSGAYQLSQQLSTPDDRHGMGHGIFSSDGTRLYTTENDFGNARGVIGIYDTQTFARLGEIDSAGIGPHELVLLPRAASTEAETPDLICVANGGQETDPDFPRMVLNEGAIESSLAFIEIGRQGADTAITSRLLGRHRLPASGSSLSIRHLAAIDSTSVCFGCQDQDASGSSDFADRLVGIASIRPGTAAALQMLKAVPEASGYIGSVAHDAQTNTVLTSAPRGNAVALWSLHNPDAAPTVHRINDACGACVPESHPGHFVVSTGFGELWLLAADGSAAELVVSTGSRHYDNHMTIV